MRILRTTPPQDSWTLESIRLTLIVALPARSGGTGHFGHKTLRHRDTSAPQNWCRSLSRITGGAVSSELSWVEVSRLFLDHGTRVEVSRTTFLVSKCLGIGAEVSQSVLMPKCLVAEVSGNQERTSRYDQASMNFYPCRPSTCLSDYSHIQPSDSLILGAWYKSPY